MTRMKLVLCCAGMFSLVFATDPGFSQDRETSDLQLSVPTTVENSIPSVPSDGSSEAHSDYVAPRASSSSREETAKMPRQGAPKNRRSRVVTRHVQEVVDDDIPAEEIEEAAKFKAAIQALKDAKNDDQKEIATQTIQQLLQRQFQRDLKRREDELAPVEQRVKALRQQLDKRKEAMSDIISLRLKTILSYAEGLGFPDDDGLFDATAAEFANGPTKKDGSSGSSSRSRRKTGTQAQPRVEDNRPDAASDQYFNFPSKK